MNTPNGDPPKFLEQARDLTHTLSQAVQKKVAGKPFRADPDLVASRQGICQNCNWLDQERLRCLRCGCKMPLKMRLLVSSCPEGKW